MLVRVYGVESGEDHRLDLFESGQRLDSRIIFFGNGVADFCVGDVLDIGNQEADFAGAQFVDLDRLGRQHAERFHVEHASIPHQANLLSFAKCALEHARQHDHAAIGIEPGVENQRLEPLFGSPLGGGTRLTMASSTSGTPWPVLALISTASVASRPTAPSIISLVRGMSALGRSILLMTGNNFEAVIDGEISIRQSLCFDALRGVHDQQCAFARGERARDFVRKIDVAGRVDQIELVSLTILRLIHHAHRVGLDGDAALALQVHGVEHLGLHLAGGERSRQLQQAVGQRGFPMVNVRNNGKIAEKSGVHSCRGQCLILTGVADMLQQLDEDSP